MSLVIGKDSSPLSGSCYGSPVYFCNLGTETSCNSIYRRNSRRNVYQTTISNDDQLDVLFSNVFHEAIVPH